MVVPVNADDLLGDDDEPIRWNTWTRVHNVHIEGEPKAVPRPLRLCGPAVRPGDPEQVIEGQRVIEGVVVEIYNATIIVRITRR
jgi:hypothetical protein